MNRQLRQQIRFKLNLAKLSDLHVAALVFIACIETRTLPTIGSPCHLKLKEIIR